jgi:hypothetical protein
MKPEIESDKNTLCLFVYYESSKRELQTKPIKECRCDERLQTRVEESTRLGCPRLVEELEHLKHFSPGCKVCLFATGLKKARAEGKKMSR